MEVLTPVTLPHLNTEFLRNHPELARGEMAHPLIERVLQFGEGGFLRGFVDWMIDGMNRKGLFSGSVVVVQPIAQGMVAKLNSQNGVYTHLARGLRMARLSNRKTSLPRFVAASIHMHSSPNI
ncbi:MAG: hypothetical protein ACLQMO_01395 [Acidobacteriaceae bacterium]